MINKLITSAINFLFFTFLTAGQAFAADASLLPNGMQQYFDNNGNPLSQGTVTFYVPNTSTFKTTWQDATKTIVNSNPVSLDAAGRAKIYGEGSYRQVLKDRNGNQVWDQVTTSYQPTGTPVAQTGDGDLVGTIKPWAGLIAPNQYAFAYGQELSRIDYSVLFTAITLQASINCTSGSPILTGFTDTTQIPIGAIIESTCAPIGSTVSSKAASTITLNNNATITVSETIRIFLYGNGNGSTTFNLPDLRGFVLAGRCNMGGTNCTILQQPYFHTTNSPNATGAKGGNQTQVLNTVNLPAYTPAGTIGNTTATGSISGSVNINDPGHSHTFAPASVVNPVPGSFYGGGGTGAAFVASVGSATTGITAGFSGSFNGVAHSHTFTGTAQGGTSTPFGIIQPTITINYIIKITPDANSAVASGVTSLGGMTGDISCGANLLCSGNIISVAGSVAAGNSGQLQYNNLGALAASSNLTWFNSVSKLNVGSAGGLTGTIGINGSISGGVSLNVPPIAGDPVVTFGSNSGTPVVTASSPLAITSATGNITCSTCVTLSDTQTLSNKTLASPIINTPTITGGTVQLLTSFSLLNAGGFHHFFASGGTFTNNRTLTFTLGDADRTFTLGGNLTTSGNNITLTATGSTNVTLPTTGTLSTLAGSEIFTNKTLTSPTINSGTLSGTFSGTPTFSGSNFVTLANIAQSATGYSLLGNTSAGAANYTNFTIGSLTQKASPAATDLVLIQDQAASGQLKYAQVSAISAAGSVASLNGQTGALTFNNGITNSGATFSLDPATQAEIEAGSITTKAVTPGRQQFHPSAAKAWCLWAGSTPGTNVCQNSYNVTNVTRNSAGSYNVNFTTAFSSQFYAVVCTISTGGGANTVNTDSGVNTANLARILTFPAGGALADAGTVSCVFFGDQ